eukprot:scaffold155727_cov38-Prasinocladus_malaysianus.AAC.1
MAVRSVIPLTEEEYCDGCKVVVEKFYFEWTKVMENQMSQVKQTDGGSRPPSITYNDATESMVGIATNTLLPLISYLNKPFCVCPRSALVTRYT